MYILGEAFGVFTLPAMTQNLCLFLMWQGVSDNGFAVFLSLAV